MNEKLNKKINETLKLLGYGECKKIYLAGSDVLRVSRWAKDSFNSGVFAT